MTPESFPFNEHHTEAQTEPEKIMNKLKLFAVTALATSMIGVGGLVAAPSASAKPMPCDRALALSKAYMVIGRMLYNDGNYAGASFYYGKADGVVQGAC